MCVVKNLRSSIMIDNQVLPCLIRQVPVSRTRTQKTCTQKRACSRARQFRAYLGTSVFIWGAIAFQVPALAQSFAPLQPQPAATIPLAPQEGIYTLGGTDQIRIDIFEVPELSGANGTYTILADGSLNLPWIGSVVLQDLTLEQAAALLTQRYARFINQPLVTVTLLTPRPVRIGVVGEVNRPGAYVTGQTAGGTLNAESATPIRTVTQAIQAAGGITQTADIRNIEVRRQRRGIGEEVIRVNLWAFLESGDLSQDMSLRDGDTLVVPRATSVTAAESTFLSAANFSPESIKVNVVGEVKDPGSIELQPNASLNQAILAAGGFSPTRARTSRVYLIRLNPDGTTTRQQVEIDLSSGVSETINPALRNNDIIVVGRSDLASVGDSLSAVLGPLAPLAGIFGILRLFSGF